MADNFNLDQARGSRAEGLLKDELLSEAFQALEDGYIKAWRETTALDSAGREKYFLAVNVIGKVKEHLQMVVANGKLAQKQLEDMAKVAEPRKRFGIV